MSRNPYRPTSPITDRLHPGLYLALVGLGLWFVLSVWAFGGEGIRIISWSSPAG